MSEWQEKSDFEINRAVAYLRSIDWQISTIDDETIIIMTSCDVFDPCNNPSDAWPVIVENKISINPCCSLEMPTMSCEPTGGWCAEHFNLQSGQAKSKNPLRAAMIVYLEMNGVKP